MNSCAGLSGTGVRSLAQDSGDVEPQSTYF